MPVATLAQTLEDAIAKATVNRALPPLVVARPSDGFVGGARTDEVLALMRSTHAPVLYAPAYEPRGKGPLRIFAPVDFLRGTEPVLALVQGLSAVLGADVVLATVVKTPRAEGERESLHDDARRALAVHARNAGFQSELLEVRVIEGDRVADRLLEQARADACDVIVMASHGKDGIARMLVGSTTESVVRQADRPVLVLRGVSG